MSSRHSRHSRSSVSTGYRNDQRRDAYEALTGERPPSILTPPSTRHSHRHSHRPHSHSHSHGHYENPEIDDHFSFASTLGPEDSISQIGRDSHRSSRHRDSQRTLREEPISSRHSSSHHSGSRHSSRKSYDTGDDRVSSSLYRAGLGDLNERFSGLDIDEESEPETPRASMFRRPSSSSYSRPIVPSSTRASSRAHPPSSFRYAAPEPEYHRPSSSHTRHSSTTSSRSRPHSVSHDSGYLDYSDQSDGSGGYDAPSPPSPPPQQTRRQSIGGSLRINRLQDGSMLAERSRGKSGTWRGYEKGPNGGAVISTKSGKKKEVSKWLLWFAGVA